MKQKLLVISMLTAFSQMSYANSSADEIAVLKQQIQLLSQKINQLEVRSEKTEKKQEEVAEKIVVKSSTDKGWYNKMKISGDIRTRYEYIDKRGSEIRQRNRVRMRVKMDMQVNERFSFLLGIATGTDNPTSTNQTYDGGFTSKDVRLDLASFKYKLSDSFTLLGGKMAKPAYRASKNELLWDGDLTPEGFTLSYDQDSVHADLMTFVLDERKSADDAYIVAGQIYNEFGMENGKLIAGVGYYDFVNIQGATPLYKDKSFGNKLDSSGGYLSDFNIAEAFVEYKTKLADKPFSVYTHFYSNTAADELGDAWTVGFKYGKVKNFGDWDVRYSYIDTEADATIGALNGSDFAGGVTDTKGTFLKANFGLGKKLSLGLTWADTENQQSTSPVDFDLFMIHLLGKFK